MSKPLTEVIEEIEKWLIRPSPQLCYDLDMLYEKVMVTPPERMADRWREFGFLIAKELGDPSDDPYKQMIYDIMLEGTKND